MGCVESRKKPANCFHVVNVNNSGQRPKEGKLEVTETELVLRQRDKTPIIWPLRCLRRYGFDAEQFSFESGRRCKTGPGVYTFKCRRAETLFNMLQVQIGNINADIGGYHEIWPPIGQEMDEDQDYLRPIIVHRGRTPNFDNSNGGFHRHINDLRLSGSPFLIPQTELLRTDDNGMSNVSQMPNDREPQIHSFPGANLQPNNLERSGELRFVDGSVVFSVSDRPCSYSSSGSDRPISVINTIERRQQYVNQAERCIEMSHNHIDPSKQDLDSSPNCLKFREFRHITPLYTNVLTDTNREEEHLYANSCLDNIVPIIPPRTPLTAESVDSVSPNSGTTTTTTDTELHNRQLTYILVDVDKGSDSSHTAPLSPLENVSYVNFDDDSRDVYKPYTQIDIEKTEALAIITKTRAELEEKARKNSTIGSSASIGQQTSTLSE